MPKKHTGENPPSSETGGKNDVFSKEEWLQKVKEKVKDKAWATLTLKDFGALRIEIVRVRDTDNLMLRISTGNPQNSIRLTRKEHIEALIDMANYIAANVNNVLEKLNALKEIMPEGRRVVRDEEI